MINLRRAVSRRIGLIAMAAVGLLLVPASGVAQYGNFETAPNLTREDIEIVRKVVREDLAGKPKGTTLPWQNTASQNSGTVTLLSEFPSQGRDCRRVRYAIKPGAGQPASVAPATYVMTTCRMPDGSWKTDNQAKPDKSG